MQTRFRDTATDFSHGHLCLETFFDKNPRVPKRPFDLFLKVSGRLGSLFFARPGSGFPFQNNLSELSLAWDCPIERDFWQERPDEDHGGKVSNNRIQRPSSAVEDLDSSQCRVRCNG